MKYPRWPLKLTAQQFKESLVPEQTKRQTFFENEVDFSRPTHLCKWFEHEVDFGILNGGAWRARAS